MGEIGEDWGGHEAIVIGLTSAIQAIAQERLFDALEEKAGRAGAFIYLVGRTGIEPVTSCLSSKR